MDKQQIAREDQQDEQVGPVFPGDDPELAKAFLESQRAEAALRALTGERTTGQTVTIALDALVEGRAFQIRGELTPLFVKRYMAAYEVESPMPPVEVAMVIGSGGKPVYYVTDGFHRIEALRCLGRTTVEAHLIACESLNEVQWRGWERNQHGVHFTRDERETAFKLYVKMGKHLFKRNTKAPNELKPVRAIARDFFRSADSVWKMMKRVEPKLHAAYQRQNAGRKERPATNDAPPSPRQFQQVDAARRDMKNIVEIAKGESAEQRQQIVYSAINMLDRLKALDTTTETTSPIVKEDF